MMAQRKRAAAETVMDKIDKLLILDAKYLLTYHRYDGRREPKRESVKPTAEPQLPQTSA